MSVNSNRTHLFENKEINEDCGFKDKECFDYHCHILQY